MLAQDRAKMAESGQNNTISIVIDGRRTIAQKGASVLSVAHDLGIEIPSLCHHQSLEPNGACRLCLVEEVVGDSSKFVTACNYPAADGMEIKTSSPKIVRPVRRTSWLTIA